jgi:threonine/homoserine/homoserine lactone efflux protein
VTDTFLTILGGAGVHLLAVVSPGPNFLVISRTALAHSRRAALGVTAGVTLGAFIIIASGFLGASAVFTRSERVFDAARLAGAAYLIFLGLKALIGLARHRSTAHGPPIVGEAPTPAGAFRLGLLTIASNAKAFVYFLVFFTAVVAPDDPIVARVILVFLMPSITFGWYAFISTAFANDRMRGVYARARAPIEVLFGVLLIGLGVEIALAV